MDALELVECNIEIFRSKMKQTDTVNLKQGNATDLSAYEDETFDMVLLLGPMYHPFDEVDRKKALEEFVWTPNENDVFFHMRAN